MRIRGEEGHVVSDPNGPHTYLSHVEAKASIVSDNQLLVVHQLKLIPSTVTPVCTWNSNIKCTQIKVKPEKCPRREDL